jgi:hypothetical protein
VPVDARAGGLATDNCPAEDIRIEHFMPGTEPSAQCPVHGSGPGVMDRLLRGLRLRGQ